MNKSVGTRLTFNQFFRRFGMLSILVVVFVISALLDSAFATSTNLINILNRPLLSVLLLVVVRWL